MCGIIGRINAARDKPVCAEELEAATRLIAHRGPDGAGIFRRGNVGLGHRRLSIVDLEGGAQPMSDPDRTLQVVFNGEIYNHAELRGALKQAGHAFRTRSDTEVLVHGYREWGDDLPSKLRGMFAFAVWDARRQRLLLARDRVGIKPLYLAFAGEDLLFASEVKSLLAFQDVRRELDPAHLGAYLALRYVPSPNTLFAGVERLLPGHRLIYEGGRAKVERYWDVPLEPGGGQPLALREEEDRVRELLRETTRLHLMGEVPFGLFLSGGVDSTAIGWAMRACGAEDLKTFSVGFQGGGEGEGDGELAWARRAAASLGAAHREVRVGPLDFRDALPELVWHLDEPNADGACIPLMLLARRAREEVTVVLSGEGADELFGGYGIYPRLLGLERARQVGGGALGFLAAGGLRVIPEGRVRKYLSMLRHEPQAHYFGVGRGFQDGLLREVMGQGPLERLAEGFAPLWARTHGAPLLHRVLYNDTRVWLPDDLLLKADKATMGASVELRVPFLDHVMLENAWRLPPQWKLRRGVGKWILRRALRGRIPEPILRRPKRGFPVPIGRWLRTSLHGACRDRLLAARGAVRGMLGAGLLARLLEEHRTGRADRTEELYVLWVLEEWHQAWMTPMRDRPLKNELRDPGRFVHDGRGAGGEGAVFAQGGKASPHAAR